MAHFGTHGKTQILLAMAVTFLYWSAAAAQSIAPSPAMDTGAGAELPGIGALIFSSLVVSLVTLLLR
ncbi:hypothetical protein NMG60_11001007 [Bertholletia excelsa]